MGYLKIGSQEIEIKKIRIESWYSHVYLEPEFSFTIEVHIPDEDELDNNLVRYDHIIMEGWKNIDALIENEIDLDEEQLNKKENSIYLEDEEYVPTRLKLSLSFEPEGFILRGEGQLDPDFSINEVNISFQAEAEIPRTLIIEYDFENYRYKLNAMIRTLETLSSSRAQEIFSYQAPEAHVPFELLNQFHSAMGKDYKWFHEMYNEQEIGFLDGLSEEAQDIMNPLIVGWDEFPNVPEIFENPQWLKIMDAAKMTLNLIKSNRDLL